MGKKITYALTGLLAIALTVLAVKGNNVLTLSSDIEIEAPPQVVWEKLVDFSTWHKWNPDMLSAHGLAQANTNLSITMKDDQGHVGTQFSPLILEATKNRKLYWRDKIIAYFIFTNDSSFALENSPDGTKLIHTESYSGLLLPFFRKQISKEVPAVLIARNRALKSLVENPLMQK